MALAVSETIADAVAAGAQLPRRLEAVHLGHVAVHQHDVEPLLIEAGQRLGAVLGDDDAMAVALQHRDRDRGVDGVVLGQQDVQARARRRVGRRASSNRPPHPRWPVTSASVRSNQNVLPTPGSLVTPTLPAHQLDQLARDGEPEAGAAEAPRHRSVGLLEGAEQAVQRGLLDADPGVDHLDPHRRRSRRATSRVERRSVTPPALVNLTALPSRLISTCRSRCGSPSSGRQRHARQIGAQGQALARRRRRDDRQRLLEHVGQLEGDALHVQLAGLDLREVEDVVDDVHQVLGRLVDDGRALELLGAERRVEQQRGHAEHAVHRRPDFVAHARQELALGPGARLGGVARLAQLGFVADARGHVGEEAGGAALEGEDPQRDDALARRSRSIAMSWVDVVPSASGPAARVAARAAPKAGSATSSG